MRQVRNACKLLPELFIELFRPLVERGDYVAGESRRLMDRLFGGKLTPLVAHLAERDEMSRQDIAEIEALLKALKQ